MKKLKQFIKYNKFFLSLYRFFGNALIAFLKIFIRIKNNRILFISFGGQKFDDSPKALFDSIKKDKYFSDYELIWAFSNPKDFLVDSKKVKVDTIKYWITALSSKIWITNSSVTRGGLKLKRKGTIEINTWHGTPLKRMGDDIKNDKSFHEKKRKIGKTIYCSQSEYDRDIWVRFFDTEKENIILSDLPRNDYLSNYNKNDVLLIKKELNIPPNKKVILYAPTFREYDRDGLNSCFINPPISLDKWQKELGKQYVLLFRAHYEVVNALGIKENEFCKNVSNYHSLNNLMVISDILISDYSSIYFDFSILERPMFCFPYDLDTYREKRGLYEEAFSKLPSRLYFNESELINALKNIDLKAMSNKSKEFKKLFAPYAGKATEVIIKELKKIINNVD